MSEMQMGEGFVGVIDRLKAEGNLTRNSGANSIKRLTATVEELVTKQDESNEISKNAAEESEKQDMFQRFDEEEESKQVAEVVEDKDKDKDEEGGGFMKSFGGFFKMLKGFVGILLAVAIPALALILNSPVFEILKKSISDFIDFFFENILPVLTVIKDKFFVAIDDIMKYFDENVLPILKNMKDQLFGVLIKLYDNVIKPLYDFFEEFMTREGGGFDILLKGLEKQIHNFKAIFDDIINILSSLIDGDLGAVKDHIFSLGANILKAVKDYLDTIIEFVLGMFGMQAEEGQGGLSMLGDVIKGFFQSIVNKISGVFDGLIESISSVIEGIMSSIQSLVRDIAGDTIGDMVFGKKAVEDLSVAERREEQGDIKGDLEDKEDDVKKAAQETGEAQDKLKKIQDEMDKIKAKGDKASNREQRRLNRLTRDETRAKEQLNDAQLEEKEARDELKADQERLKQINESLGERIKKSGTPTDEQKAASAATNGAPGPIAPTNIVTGNNNTQTNTENKTAVDGRNKPTTGAGTAAVLNKLEAKT